MQPRRAATVAEEVVTWEGARLASAVDLFESGATIQKARLVADEPNLADDDVAARLAELSLAKEVGKGLRLAPERLEKLRIRDED